MFTLWGGSVLSPTLTIENLPQGLNALLRQENVLGILALKGATDD